MSKLAIKGHLKRGSEVIERLEMLGGNNIYKYNADCNNAYFYIGENSKNIYCNAINVVYDVDFVIFTLEEFEEKFPYKVGDKVSSKYLKNYKIVKMEWKDTNNRVIYKLQGMGWYNSDELEYYKEENMEQRQYKELRMPLDDDDKLATEVTIDGNKILPPNGYLIGKITQVDNGMLVEYVKQQPSYPKTHEECFNICFGNKHHIVQVVGLDDLGDNKELFESFIKLKICRDAYWKIAVEEKKDDIDYVICNVGGKVINTNIPNSAYNHILTFPTEEMRDAFYENFKDLIERCKELL